MCGEGAMEGFGEGLFAVRNVGAEDVLGVGDGVGGVPVGTLQVALKICLSRVEGGEMAMWAIRSWNRERRRRGPRPGWERR